ncbi:MAG: hypothetical protein ABFD46_09370 [Armatimonadota bacterium]
MKKVLFVLAVLSLLAVGQLAQATYLDSSWYAQLSNVQTTGPYGLGGQPQSSTHIKVSGVGESALFTIPQSVQAPTDEKASWWNMTLDPGHLMGSISFDYTTNWTQPNLVLQLTALYLGPYQQDTVVWTSSLTGLRTNHAIVDADPCGYRFDLVVLPQVPEPGSLFALGSLCGVMAAGLVQS